MIFNIDDKLLRDLFALCSFPVPDDELVFFSLRGSQPLEFGGTAFAESHKLMAMQIDYRHMRCTIGQWRPADKTIAVFVGSSVPNVNAIQDGLGANGTGVNRLASGLFGQAPGSIDYRYYKGNHGFDRHLAFRNDQKLPVWRTADDLDFAGDDRFEIHKVVYDNLHCARQVNETANVFSSNGCVVVAGRPGDSNASKLTSELGPWKKFLANAYGLPQLRFALAIFEENEALRIAELGIGGRGPTVRFGSRGILVERVQAGLIAKGYDVGGAPDGRFGLKTALALHRFQRDTFGPSGTDLIAGRATADALGIAWPANGSELAALLAPLPHAGSASGVAPDSHGVADAGIATSAPAGVTHDAALKIEMDVTHAPLPGWTIKANAAGDRWTVQFAGQATPLNLGKLFVYNDYPEGPTRGLARTSGMAPKIPYNPADWTDLGHWPELIFPTAFAESNANFAVVNCWDRAAITFGFIQLAAHTGDDLLPFFRRLATELPSEMKQWFPELAVIDGKLCFVKNNRYRSLENAVPAYDGGFSASYYHGDLMAYFNPDRYHKTRPIDQAELHASARWFVWSLTSAAMRRVQVKASIESLRGSLRFLHAKMLADPAVKALYPRGVDGMRCDLLAVALAVPHLGEGNIPVALRALRTADPIEKIRISGYGPGGRAQNVHDGMLARPILRNLVYDLTSGNPV